MPELFGHRFCFYTHSLYLLFGLQIDNRNDHLFQRNASVLECVAIEVNILVIVVWISEEVILFRKDVGSRHVRFRQKYSFRFATNHQMVIVESEIFAVLVT